MVASLSGKSCLGIISIGYDSSFLERTANVAVSGPRHSVVFRRLVRLGSFPASWIIIIVRILPRWTIFKRFNSEFL